MPLNWWDIYPEVLPSPAAGPYPLPRPGGIVPGPAMGLGPALGLGGDPLSGAPRLGQAPDGGFDPSFLSGAPMLGQFAGSSPDQAPPSGYPQPPLAGDQSGPLPDRRLAVQQAAAAIRDGADPRAVRARLNQMGTDNPGFDPFDSFSDLLPGGQQRSGMMNPPQGLQPNLDRPVQLRLASNSMPGRYGLNGVVDDATAQMPASAGVAFAKQPQAFSKAGGGPAETGVFGGMQRGSDARFYPAAYAQDHLDTEQDWQVAYEMAKQRGGDPQDWFQMLRSQSPGPVRDSLPPNAAGRAAALPNDHPFPNPSHMEGDDIVVTGPPRATREAAQLQELRRYISSGEGNYESYNSGTVGRRGPVGYSSTNSPVGTVTGKTINEILSTESLSPRDPRRMHAVGRYQIIIPTLRSAVRAMHLTGNERLTPELQDRIFAEFLVPPPLRNFVLNGTGSVDDAQYAAARQWASIAVPRGRLTKLRRRSDGNMTFFDDTGPANSASRSATNALRTYLMNLHK